MTSNPRLKAHREKQFDLFSERGNAKQKKTTRLQNRVVFVDPDPNDLYLGMTSLKDHLKELKQTSPLIIRSFLSEFDWSSFIESYKPGGAPPYAPWSMLGLILYGLMNGQSSLRQLENLARLDLGGMWVSGGIYPDHATIGRFILLHQERLSVEFFEAVTRSILEKTGSKTHSVAGDGTIIEAACSRYRLLKKEAMAERALLLEKAAKANPENLKKQRKSEQANEAKKLLKTRIEAREAKGRNANGISINPLEPEAVVQPQKHSGYSASYKPSVLANEHRIVVAQTVHPSAEVSVIPELLDQCVSLSGETPNELMLDAGYFCDQIVKESLEREISLLCPEGNDGGRPKEYRRYPKSQFIYNELEDHYLCPAGHEMRPISFYKGTDKYKGYVLYGTPDCKTCPLKEKCTKSQNGRQVKRYPSDEMKDALRQVMLQPKAQQRFKYRKAMVEPVFSVLRGVHGLTRFKRNGLKAVKLEFALHILAYNLSRLIALLVILSGFCIILILMYEVLVGKDDYQIKQWNYQFTG